MATKTGIYCRISRDREGDGLGVQRQEKDCRSLAKKRGWDVADVYVDDDISAHSGKMRPQYLRLLGDLRSRRINAVVIWHPDRLHRSPSELEDFITIIESTGAAIATCTAGEYDLTTPDGRLSARIVGAVARKESEDKARRIRRKHLELAENGRPSGGGTRAFGFDSDGRTVRPGEAALIKEAADRVLQGESLYAICNDWNARQIETVTGARWSVTSIRTMLRRPRVAGRRQYQGEDFGPAGWPAILDQQTWRRVKVILEDPNRKQAAPSRTYLFYGVIFCAECGHKLTAMPRKNGENYGCRKTTGGCGHVYVTRPKVEAHLLARLLPIADLPQVLTLFRRDDKGTEKEVREVVGQIAADEKARSSLADDHYQHRLIDRPTFIRQTKALDAKIDANRDRLASLHGSALAKFGGQVQEQWRQLSTDDKRLVIRSLVERIDVTTVRRRGGGKFDSRRVDITWRKQVTGRLDALALIAEQHAKQMTPEDWAAAEQAYLDENFEETMRSLSAAASGG